MKTIIIKFKEVFKLASNVGFLHLLSANLLIQIAGFGGQIFLTRILSLEDIGTIKILQSYLNILIIIASLGLNTAILKLCSEDIGKPEKRQIFTIGFLITGITSIVLIFIVTILIDFSIVRVNNLLKTYVYLIPVITLTNLIIVYLQSQQKIKTMSLIQSISKIFIVLFSTIFAYMLGLSGYIYSLVILNFITFFVIIPPIKKEFSFINLFRKSKRWLKPIFNIGLFAFGANLLGVLLLNINIIMANSLTNNTIEIGYYSIAQLIITA